MMKPKQKSILTITDCGRGKITMALSFVPPLKTKERMTPATGAAIECMRHIIESAKSKK